MAGSSTGQRLLRADDAELVALWIGENDPCLVASLTDVDGSCAEGDEALDLRFTFAGTGVVTWVEIEMPAVLDDLVVGARHKAYADGRIVGRADDDLPLAFGEDGPVDTWLQKRARPGRSWASMTTWWRDTGTS